MTLAVLVWAVTLGASAAAQQQVYDIGNDVVTPVPITRASGEYTPRARAAKIQGAVWLIAVVQPDGTVDDVKVMRSLHPDLDEQAVAALKRWEFKPGTREGKPVAVRFTIQMSFMLK
jgi:TonB family protein